MSAVKQMIMDILKSDASNEIKYKMTDALMNWKRVGIGMGMMYDYEDEYADADLYDLASSLNEAIMDWSAARFDEIYHAYQTNTPIVIGHDYWSRFCSEALLGLSQLPATNNEAWDELDIPGNMCDEFVNLAAGPKMEMIVFLLNENNF